MTRHHPWSSVMLNLILSRARAMVSSRRFWIV
jgi:hypothetical protein